MSEEENKAFMRRYYEEIDASKCARPRGYYGRMCLFNATPPIRLPPHR
jgi:hypothetical protein